MLHSERVGAPVFLGKRQARATTSAHVPFADVLKSVPPGLIPPIPTSFGHGLDFGYSNWLMLGNGPDGSVFPGFKGAGDCFWAGQAHSFMESAKNAGRPIPQFTGLTVVTDYGDYIAAVNNGQRYDPQVGENDNGTDVQEGLERVQEIGLHDVHGATWKIGQTFTLTPGDLNELWACAYLLEEADVGVRFQQAQMDQFDNGAAWDYVPGSSDEGGHFIIVPGRVALISWGHRIRWTQAWYENLNDETYGHMDLTRYNAVTGEDAEHYTQVDAEKFIVLVAQQKAQAA